MSYHDNVQQYTSCLRVCILGDPLEVRALGHSYLDASMSLLAQRNMTGYEANPNKQSPKELPRTARHGLFVLHGINPERIKLLNLINP